MQFLYSKSKNKKYTKSCVKYKFYTKKTKKINLKLCLNFIII